MKVSKQVIKAIRDHMLAVFPHEGVGIIVGRKFIPLQNTHENPVGEFSFDESVFLTHKVRAVIHSHPYSANRPSVKDTNVWRRGGKNGPVWGIVACDGERVSDIFWMDAKHPAPLEGRTFIYGYQDCGSIVRDWYWMTRKVWIPDFDRDPDWRPNRPHADVYSALIGPAGFREVQFNDLQVGDVLLMSLLGGVMHHAAVYLGDGKILHQLHAPGLNMLSCVQDLLGEWDKHVVKVVRHKSNKK